MITYQQDNAFLNQLVLVMTQIQTPEYAVGACLTTDGEKRRSEPSTGKITVTTFFYNEAVLPLDLKEPAVNNNGERFVDTKKC